MKEKKQFKFKKAQAGRQNQPADYIDRGDTSIDPSKLPFSQTPTNLVKNKQKFNTASFFDYFNPLALGVTAAANTINDYKNRKDEQNQYLQYLQTKGFENPNEQGLNMPPIYTQFGGRTTYPLYELGGMSTYPWYQMGGYPVYEDENGRIPTYPMYSQGGETPTLDLQTYPQYKDGGFGKYSRDEILKYLNSTDGYSVGFMKTGGLTPQETHAILNSGSVNGHDLTSRQTKFFKLVAGGKSPEQARSIINKEFPKSKTGGNWIPKDLHKGRCTPMGTAECPPGSPQYRLAETFKKHHGFHKAKFGYDEYGGLLHFPYGGGPLTSSGAREIIKDGTVHGNPLTPQQKKYFGFIAGGGKPSKQSGGQAAPTIEAEGGETYMTPNDQIKKIPDAAPDHEHGGVLINDADRVLEDTSTYRNDLDSQTLKLPPVIAEALTGVKPKGAVSHSQALEDAKKHYGKFAFKLNKGIEKNIDTLDKNKLDKYATNSLNLNLAHLNQLPTDGELFDNLFQHQELLKQIAGIDQTKEACMGGKYACMGGEYKSGGKNFKSVAAYKKWLAFGHIHKAFEKTPGNQKVSIKGNEHSVKHAQFGANNNYNSNLEIFTTPVDNTGSGASPKVKFVKTSNGKIVPITDRGLLSGKADLIPTSDDFSNLPFSDKSGFQPEGDSGYQTPLNRFNFKQQPNSQFDEPLQWYDIAGPLGNYISATDRIPAKFNPVQFNKIRLHQQNPTPQLQAGQADYDSALKTLPPTGVGFSNLSRLFAGKYDFDNQVLGNNENINKNILNQQEEYNANVGDRQSMADQEARARFEQQFLGSLEAQRQQKLQSLDELYSRFAQNKALNRNANLIMKLAPAFDENGNFNGYQRTITSPDVLPQFSQNQPTGKMSGTSRANDPYYHDYLMYKYLQSKTH